MMPSISTDSVWQTARGADAAKRAAPLKAAIKRGGSVRRTHRDDVERRLPSGQVAGRYGLDVLELAISEGWLVETRRRRTADGSGVEVEYAYQATEAEAPAPKPTRATAPPKVRRTVRRKAAPEAPQQDLPFGMEVISAEAAADILAAVELPRQTAPKLRRHGPHPPLLPDPLPDGTECLTRDQVTDRYPTTKRALAMAIHAGNVDTGTPYTNHPGRWALSVALTPRTVRYAEAVWVAGDKFAFRDNTQFTRPGPRPHRRLGDVPTGPVRLVEGSEMLTRELATALGYAAVPDSLTRSLAEVPNRYVHPTNPRRGRLWTAGPELVEAAARLGVEVTLTDAAPAAPPASAPRRAQPVPEPSGDGHWSSLLPEAAPTGTPVFA